MASSWLYECPVDIETVVCGDEYNRVPDAISPDNKTPPPLGTMQDVHDVLSNCSTVKTLKIRLEFSGCTGAPDRFNFPFDLSGTTKYSSTLEVLHLKAYHFDDSEWEKVQPPKSLFPYGWWPTAIIDGLDNYLRWYRFGSASKYYGWLGLPEEQRKKTNIDLWIEAMDFSHIRELGLERIRDIDLIIERLIPRLASLTSLTIRDHEAPEFIKALPKHSLEHLSWIATCRCRISKATLDVVRHHAKSLISLERREPEGSCSRRSVMTAEELATLGDTLSNLQRLAVDLNRDGTWPMEELEAIATHFPKLTVLELYLEMASERQRKIDLSKWRTGVRLLDLNLDYHPARCPDHHDLDKLALPLLTKTSATELFQTLRQKKVGEELLEVKFLVGDWERPRDRGHDGGYDAPDWLEQRNAWVSCKVDPNGFADGHGQVICEGIDTEVSSDGSREESYYFETEEEELRKLQQEMAF